MGQLRAGLKINGSMFVGQAELLLCNTVINNDNMPGYEAGTGKRYRNHFEPNWYILY